MRTVYSFLACWLLATGVWAQGRLGVIGGQIVYGNYVPPAGINAPVFDVDCQTRLEGPRFVWEVYAGLAPDQLQPLGLILPFKTGPAAGYIESRIYDIPGAHTDDLAYTQLRAWDSEAGPTYEAAVVAGGKYGASNIVPIYVVWPPGPPEWPIGLQSFCLVPEPSSLVLLGCGVVALVMRAALFFFTGTCARKC